MHRGETGRYEVTRLGGEVVPAYVPAPLPPHLALVIRKAVESGELNGQSSGDQTLKKWVLRLSKVGGV